MVVICSRLLLLLLVCGARKDKTWWSWEQVNHSIWSGVPVIHINHYKFVVVVSI